MILNFLKKHKLICIISVVLVIVVILGLIFGPKIFNNSDKSTTDKNNTDVSSVSTVSHTFEEVEGEMEITEWTEKLTIKSKEEKKDYSSVLYQNGDNTDYGLFVTEYKGPRLWPHERLWIGDYNVEYSIKSILHYVIEETLSDHLGETVEIASNSYKFIESNEDYTIYKVIYTFNNKKVSDTFFYTDAYIIYPLSENTNLNKNIIIIWGWDIAENQANKDAVITKLDETYESMKVEIK